MIKTLEKENICAIEDAPNGWYGEWVSYDTEEEAIEAAEYLALWRKFFAKKLRKKIVQTSSLISRPGALVDGRSTLGLKIQLGEDE